MSRSTGTLTVEIISQMPDPRRGRWKKPLGVAVANMRAVSSSTLALAALCSTGAFTTLAFYEVVVVRYVKTCIGRAKPVVTAFIAFPLGHAVGQAMLSGGALRYRMYTPAGFSATEVGATVLLANLPYALAFGLLIDLALVLEARTLEPLFRIQASWLFAL